MSESTNPSFDFIEIERPLTLRLTGNGGYLNSASAKYFRNQGEYIKFEVDPSNQAIKVSSFDDPGEGRYRIFNNSGASIQVRKRLTGMGMNLGVYLYIGEYIFQHVDNII